jgi:hypothetical protein
MTVSLIDSLKTRPLILIVDSSPTDPAAAARNTYLYTKKDGRREASLTLPAECALVHTRASHEPRQHEQVSSSSSTTACVIFERLFVPSSCCRAGYSVRTELATARAASRKQRNVSRRVASASTPSLDPYQPLLVGHFFDNETRRAVVVVVDNVNQCFFCRSSGYGATNESSAATATPATTTAPARIHRPNLRAAVGPAVGKL